MHCIQLCYNFICMLGIILCYTFICTFFQSKGIYYSGTVVFCCHSVWQLSHTNCWKYFCSVTDPCYERKWMKMAWAMKMAWMKMALYENVPGWPLTSSDHEGVFIRLYWLSRQFSNYIKEKTTTFNSIIYDLLTIHKDVEMLLGLQGVFSPAEPKSSINFHLYSALHSVFNNPEKKECTGRKFERLNNFKN